MGEDFSNKRVLIYDDAQFTDIATRLAKDWGSVQYYNPWEKFAPESTSAFVGTGLENVERVFKFFKAVPGADLIVFTGCYRGDIQVFLEDLGYRIWGSRDADRFEWDRELFKETLKQVGLPVNKYKVITGLTKLREYLSEHDDQIVKIPIFRGDTETFDCPSYVLRKSKIDAMETFYGPFSERVKFVVEAKINTKIECGYDGYCIDGNFTDGFIDYETKNRSCLIAAKPYAELPEPVRFVNEKFAPLLKRERYRAPFGTEIRVDAKGDPYFIDLTGRNSSPPGEALWCMTENLSELMYYGAVGESLAIEWAAPYACQIILNLEWEDRDWTELFIPNSARDWVKLSCFCKADGLYYPIQNEGHERVPWKTENIGSAIGIGKTIQEAIEKAQEHAAAVQGFKITYDIAAVAEGIKAIIAGEKEGIEFSDGQIPEPGVVLETAD